AQHNLGDQPGIRRYRPARDGAGLVRAGGVPGARAAADALRALETDRGGHHALGADRPLAAGAADTGLPVRVPVTGGHRPLSLRLLRLSRLLRPPRPAGGFRLSRLCWLMPLAGLLGVASPRSPRSPRLLRPG